MNPVDCINQRIELHAQVVFGRAGSSLLFKGTVTKINAKTVTIKHDEYNNGPYSTITDSRRAFEDVVVVGVQQ